MNLKTVLGISLAAVLAIAIVFPLAEAITSINQTEVKVKNGQISKLKFELNGPVETQPFGGYAILTNANPTTAIAITSHAGFYDNEKQAAPSLTPIIQFDGPAALCTAGDSGCGAEWHVHVVIPAADNRCATGLKVGELTFNDPSNRLQIAGENLIARGIPLEVNQYTAALAGGQIGFDAGTNPGTSGLAFDLTPIFLDPNDPTTLDAVCIGPLAP